MASPVAQSSAPPLLAQIQFEFSHAVQLLAGTHVGAFVIGRESQYEAMHAPAPDFSKAREAARKSLARPQLQRPVIPRVFHAGIEVRPKMRDPRTINTQTLPPDPLAMSRKDRMLVHHMIASPAPIHRMTAGATAGSGVTGINPWWTYEEGAVPGVGKWMVNVGTGNLLVQETDLDVPERGIDLAFRMTYNSMSQHDSANTDGSVPSNYGNGWTNTFDAHLGYNAASNVITVWDIDGARYDYTANGSGGWTPPPGQHASLVWDGACGYLWTKKTGTRYDFTSPTAACGQAQGYWGRLYIIQARNHNNWIRFDYSWDNGDASTSAHLSQINAVHADGQMLTLKFADFNGHRELANVTRPDGAQITYGYDASGDLTSVTLPSNNSGYGTHQYGWYAGHQVNWVDSPRWDSGSAVGGYDSFWFDSSARISALQTAGIDNFTPDDGTGVVLQSGPSTSNATITYVAFGYPSATETQMSDADGHATNWYLDALGRGRAIETQEWTGAPNNVWLSTYATWDDSNNLAESIDPRGNPTDYGYDGNGNTIWVQQPQVTTSLGTGRPVARYSYDQYNNLVAYCDPQYVWTTGVTSCSAASGATYYKYNYSDANEPYGYLTDTYTPLGYHVQITYDPANEAGADAGLPTMVQGDPISQPVDTFTPSRRPTQTIQYDQWGNVISYDKGKGMWSLTYDTQMNRLLVAKDPDGYSSYTCYYTNGQTEYTETAQQHVMDGAPSACQATAPPYAVAYSYDANGNAILETHHHGCVSGQSCTADLTRKWYDGADRLVEVQQAHDADDVYMNQWTTRYLYDLTQGGTVALSGSSSVSYRAYGNLYKTQELLPSATSDANLTYTQGAAKLANGVFADTSGNAFDALDRATAKYQFINDVPEAETFAYDVSPKFGSLLGLLTQHCNALAQCGYPDYDLLDRQNEIEYSDSTPTETTTFDPDGRVASVASARFGTQSYTYDADGRTVTSTDPSSGGVTGGATQITHNYYADGSLKSVDVNAPGATMDGVAFNQVGLFRYGYRSDGETEVQQINLPQSPNVGTTTLTFGYTSAGRLVQRTESGPGANSAAEAFSYAATGNIPTPTGQLTGASFPGGAITTTGYDAEGELTGYTSSYTGGSQTLGPDVYTYSTRGELKKESAFPLNSGPLANGLMLTFLPKTDVSDPPQIATWDGRRAVQTGATQGTSANGAPYTYNTAQYAYDTSGRQTSDAQKSDVESECNVDGSQLFQDAINNTTTTRTYDAENHLTGGQWNVYVQAPYGSHCALMREWGAIALGYDWGPNGHPIRVGSSPEATSTTGAPTPGAISYDTLHWDGNQLLFTTNSSGAIDDIKVGQLGDITPLDPQFKGLTFWDREFGKIVYCHNSQGYSGSGASMASLATASPSPCIGNSMPTSFELGITTGCPVAIALTCLVAPKSSTVGQGGLLAMPRDDGFTDGFNVIQGIRAMDPGQGSWTTPDAYAGDVHDPMSQKSYMWNNNNGVAYSDPSGYDALYRDYYHEGDTPIAQMEQEQNDNSPAVNGSQGNTKPNIDTTPKTPSGVTTAAGAAIAAGQTTWSASHDSNTEYGGRWFCLADGSCGYSISPDSGKHVDQVDSLAATLPQDTVSDGVWHSHVYIPGHANEHYDDADIYIDYYVSQSTGFLITPRGNIVMDVYLGINGLRLRGWNPLFITVCQGCAK